MKKVSACIVTYNDESTVLRTVETLLQFTKGVELKIYISDNGSSDHALERIREKFPQVIILESDCNRGFGAGNNAVLSQLDSDYHVLVNPDIEIDHDVLTQMADYMDTHTDVGILTPKVLNMDGTVQHLPKLRPKFIYLLSGRLHFLQEKRDHFTFADREVVNPEEIDFCTGCFMFLRTDLFRKVGGFDERYFLYLEDADLTREIQKYAKAVYHPDMTVFHKWHRASGHSVKYLLIHIHSMFKYFWKWNIRRGK
ncbi:MAG: glycosyltransferase family 2 protein [Massiliimalia sp.]|jgi:GT2 family glycosyltransferase